MNILNIIIYGLNHPILAILLIIFYTLLASPFVYFFIKIYKSLFNSKNCPFCGEKIPKKAIICKHCGRQIETVKKVTIDQNYAKEEIENIKKEPLIVTKVKETISNELITCRVCNHEIPINSKTCMYCGTKEFR